MAQHESAEQTHDRGLCESRPHFPEHRPPHDVEAESINQRIAQTIEGVDQQRDRTGDEPGDKLDGEQCDVEDENDSEGRSWRSRSCSSAQPCLRSNYP
jgi:hypothetical protein